MFVHYRVFSAVAIISLLAYMSTAQVAQGSQDKITGSITVTAGGFRFDRRTGEFAQLVTVENKGTTSVARPVYVLEGLDTRINVHAAVTNAAVSGAVPTFAAAGRDGNSLQPGERAELVLRFKATEGVSLAYKPRILVVPSR